MRLRTALGPWSAAFFTTLGLPPLVACGGTTVSRSGDGSEIDSGKTQQTAGGGSGNTGGLPLGGARGASGGSSGAPYVGPGGAGAGLSAGGAGAGGFACQNPQPHYGPDGKPTGFVDCDNGAIARVEPVKCGRVLRGFECLLDDSCNPDAGMNCDGHCRYDTDCTARPNGYCAGTLNYRGGCACQYGCAEDSDCSPGFICLCGSPAGECVPANCTQAADCDGLSCLVRIRRCEGIGFACQTRADTCAVDTDCDSTSECAWNGGVRNCQARSICPVDGRPFLVGGAARVAGAVAREDWTSALAPCVDDLDLAAKRLLAARWTEIGLMEHASIAAFARFALEIMSLGAPPELVVATHAAMADETVHARDAFALASAYAGERVGPGRLDIDAALTARTPLDIVRTTILEGCIGETVAAVEAAEALAQATDPAVREALERVTVDETRHAELAWRFVQWALEQADVSLRMQTAAELVRIVEKEIELENELWMLAACHRSRMTDARALLAHGAVGTDTRQEIRRRVLREIVLPCARALVHRGEHLRLPRAA